MSLCVLLHCAGHHHHHHHHQWTLPFAGVGQVAATAARQQQERKGRIGGGGFMDSGSRSSGGAGFDDDDGVAARREVSSSLKGTPIPFNSARFREKFCCSGLLAASMVENPRVLRGFGIVFPQFFGLCFMREAEKCPVVGAHEVVFV